MGSILRRGLRATAALVAASILLGGTGLVSADTDTQAARPGAAGLGDYLFPNLGNGGYDAQHYTLRLSYPTSAPDQPVQGVIRMDAVATQTLSQFNLDYGGDSVASVRVDGKPARFDWQKNQTTEELVITPPRALRKGRTFSAEITFTSHPTAPAAGDLFPLGWIASSRGSFTSFQPDGAHHSIPVNDHPSDNATWHFDLDVPSGVTAVANGVPAGLCNANGRTVFSYDQRQPMAAELMQLAVGDDLNIVQRGTVDGVTMRDVIASGPRELFEPGFANGPEHVRWLTDKLGPFPFTVYGNLGVDQQFAYALETQGLSLYSPTLYDPTFRPDLGTGQPWFFRAVQVHEDAHQYFGNSVSPVRWSDVWLNEGPATWFEKVWEEETGTIDEWGHPSLAAYMRDVHALGDQWRAQYGPVARPLPSDFLYNSPQIYDGGALVLYALRQQVGDAKFRDILRGWVQRNKGTSRSTDDFIAHANRVSGQNLTDFLRAWLYGTTTPPMPGHPDWTVDPVDPAKPATARSLAKRDGGPAWSHTRQGQRNYDLTAGG